MRMVCRLGGVCMLAAILGGCCVDSKTMEGSIADAVGELWFLMSIEMDRTVTLNPDGSGKMEMATRLSAKDFIASHGQHADMNLFKRYAYRYAQLLVVETNGIDAWSGVTVEFCENGDSIIKGVAYFRDPAAVGLSASAGPNGHGFVWLSYNSSSKIAMVDGTSLESGKKYAVVSISNAELQRKIQAAKGKCDERMSLIGTEFVGVTTTYIFPGLISQAHGFRKVDNNSAQIRTSYKMVEDAYAKVLADSKLTPGTSPANSERHLDTNNEYFVEALYGDRNPRVTVSADNLTPLFDYKGEVDYAKFAHGEMVLRLQAQLDQLSPDTSENRLAETQPDAASQPTADEVKVR